MSIIKDVRVDQDYQFDCSIYTFTLVTGLQIIVRVTSEFLSGCDEGIIKDYLASEISNFLYNQIVEDLSLMNKGFVVKKTPANIYKGMSLSGYHEPADIPNKKSFWVDDSVLQEVSLSVPKYSTPKSTPQKLPDKILAEKLPDLNKMTNCPSKSCGKGFSISNVIIHLNDTHEWTRERIADWLETLDANLKF